MSDTFNDLVARKTQQQQTRIQTAQSVGQTLDIVQEQLQMEQAQYDQLDDDGVAAAPLTEVEKQRLAPGIETTGMSDKHATKVKTRTLKNLKKGRSEVGQMATSQTIPLMRSMRRNAKALREEREKEVTDISALANLVIPADIFDVALTKEHSHFDVKKALLIKEQLRKIADFKENHLNNYLALDFDVYTRLEMLLDEKDAFETTLKTVLAANGLTETGEKASDQEIHDAREKYYIVKDSYRETMESHDANLAQAMTEEKARRAKALYDPKAELDKKQAMVKLLTEKWDGELREKDGNWVPLTERFMMSEFYDRAVFRMDADDMEKSYRRMRAEINAFRLIATTVSDKERDQIFRQMKSDVAPEYDEFRKKLPGMIDKIQKATTAELIAMAPEIMAFELPIQHLSDIMKRSKDSKGISLKESFDLSQSEFDFIEYGMNMISSIKKRIVVINGLRAAQAGVPIKVTDLDSNLQRITKHLADANGIIPQDVFLDEMKHALPSVLDHFSGFATAELKKQKKIHGEKKAEQEHRLETSPIWEEKGEEIRSSIMTHLTTVLRGDSKAIYRAAIVHRISTQDLRPVWELFKQSGLRCSMNANRTDPEVLEEDFKQMFRELMCDTARNLDMNSDDLVTQVDEVDCSIQSLMTFLEKPDDEHALEFFRPLISFDSAGFYSRLDRDILEHADKRVETVEKMMAETHPVLSLKQFYEEFLKDSTSLSAETRRIIMAAVDKFDAFQRNLNTYSMPAPISSDEILEVDLPKMKALDEVMDLGYKIGPAAQKGLDGYLEDHPLVTYTIEEKREITRLGVSRAALPGSQTEDGKPTLLPITREQLQKTASADASFVKELAEKVSSFSFIGEAGRLRIFYDSEAKELLRYATEDFKYYSEMALHAKLLMVMGEKNSDAVNAALGEDADKILTAARRINAVYETMSARLIGGPGQMVSQTRNVFKSNCGEPLETVTVMREEQKLAYEEERERIMRKNATL